MAALLWLPANAAAAKQYSVNSPNGQLRATVQLSGGSLSYSVTHAGTAVLAPSEMSMTLEGGRTLGKGIKRSPRAHSKQLAFNRSTPFYRQSSVSLKCNQLTLNFGDYSVQLQVYDEGLAYRFVTAMPDSINVVAEKAEFTLPADCTVYTTKVNSKKKTYERQLKNSFESTYECAPLSAIDRSKLCQGPLLAKLPGGKSLLIADYNTFDYPGMMLYPADGNRLEAYFAAAPLAQHQGGHNNLQMLVDSRHPYIARTAGTRAFPWKMMLVATTDAQLLTCNVPVCLADESKIHDTSWIKPGKVAWDWWNAWNLKGVDFRTGVNNDTYRYYIDFAARHGIEYVILDEGWAVNKKADLMQVVPEINLEQLVAYASERGVGLVLWAGYKAFARDIEGVCAHYAKMGIKGFKIDFMDRNDQDVVRFLEDAARIAAKHHLFVDFHGVCPPAGLQHTWPNVLNFEAVAGLEQVKWSTFEQYDEVRHETLLPFIRQTVGPMDFTQGAMRNATRANYYKCYTQPMSQGTRCRQLALYMILESPFNMLCDAPTSYEANEECTRFIAAIPTVWDETRALHAELGKCVVEARRKGNTWWIGGITDWDERDVELDLGFLQGRQMTIFTDGVNADRNAEDYRVQTSATVPATLKVHLAPGGGFAAMVK
ncbi:MAG: glycoside hydrolase family 97 protein [Bacteroidales bacterium]|nr:glycoside hydrolase family 97 protein [Bacteroidales bacterium]